MLLYMLSKRQSSRTVLLRTPVAKKIMFNQGKQNNKITFSDFFSDDLAQEQICVKKKKYYKLPMFEQRCGADS